MAVTSKDASRAEAAPVPEVVTLNGDTQHPRVDAGASNADV